MRATEMLPFREVESKTMIAPIATLHLVFSPELNPIDANHGLHAAGTVVATLAAGTRGPLIVQEPVPYSPLPRSA